MLYDVVMFLKGMAIHPQLVETQNSGRDVPFGAIGAWSKAQRAEWQHSALHVVDTVVTPVSAASFPDCLFLGGSLSPQEGQS